MVSQHLINLTTQVLFHYINNAYKFGFRHPMLLVKVYFLSRLLNNSGGRDKTSIRHEF